jgi:hypothetical protein
MTMRSTASSELPLFASHYQPSFKSVPLGSREQQHAHAQAHPHGDHDHGHSHSHAHSHSHTRITLPNILPSKEADHFDKSSFSAAKLYPTIQRFLRTILSDKRTRNIFFYLLLNLSFMVVEVLYGIWCNSLGLIGDGVHMLFDSTAIILSLTASVVAKWDATDAFSYGLASFAISSSWMRAFAKCSDFYFCQIGLGVLRFSLDSSTVQLCFMQHFPSR